MTLTTHAATGMIITQWTNNPILGFFAALMSHYLLDAIPHADEWIYWRHVHNSRDTIALIVAACDVFVLSILLIAVLNTHSGAESSRITAGVIGGILPDILITLHTKSRRKFRNAYHGIMQKLQHAYHFFLQKHYTFHMTFHNVMHAPIRFRTALFYQSLYIIWFVFYFI
ncbi:MAG: hypothetical protein HYV32_05785 [Candidatus Kerfeldbacteria bacterium]|nr:hypothetical protein [Candidatus Kerfeldbacteria bacterium]